ncbi:MAG TPA: NfeD family protein [Crinalium sp.]
MISIVQAIIAFFAQQGLTEFPHEREGEISEVIEPGRVWRVSHQASYWFARSRKRIHLSPGDRVRVVDRQGIVLLIEPLETEE